MTSVEIIAEMVRWALRDWSHPETVDSVQCDVNGTVFIADWTCPPKTMYALGKRRVPSNKGTHPAYVWQVGL